MEEDMNQTDKRIEEIYKKYGSEKIICDINDKSLKIRFVKSYVWIFPLIMALGCLFNYAIVFNLFGITGYVFFLGITFLTIRTFLDCWYTLYFKDNYLILENKLKKKKIINISNFPRIYIRYRESYQSSYNNTTSKKIEQYNLHIKQNDVDITLDIVKIGSKKISALLENLQYKEDSEVNESQCQSSLDERENDFLILKKDLNRKGKIVGIKDTNKKMKIAVNSCILYNFLVIVFIASIFLLISLLLAKEFMLAGFIGAFVLVMLFVLKQEKEALFINISYPNENIIEVNKNRLNFKDNVIKISIDVDEIFLPTANGYNYCMFLHENERFHIIHLYYAKQEKIKEFLDNLIFEQE